MELLYLIYFVVGIAVSILFTVQIRYIDHDKAIPASATSFLMTVVNFFLWYNILTQSEMVQGIIGILCYALGIGVGTFIAMKMKIRYKGKDLIG